MGKTFTKEQLKEHKESALQKLSLYLDSLIENPDPKISGKASKLCYWLKDWSRYLDHEPKFKATSLRRYKRGEIIKAHLGYNVGSEEGGLHYCVVLDKQNSINSPIITIIPLTSVKPKTDLEHLPSGSIYLGNELFTNLNSKTSSMQRILSEQISELTHIIDSKQFKKGDPDLVKRLEQCRSEVNLLQRMASEISGMKKGSIALTRQIRTISKIRIYDPKSNHDVLSGVKLSNEKLDLIDSEIIKSFTGFKSH